MCQFRGLIDGGECCGDDPDDCSLTTVEGDEVRDACTDVIHLVNNIHELVGEAEGSGEEPSVGLFTDACNSLTIVVGELVRAVVAYGEPDAGLESLD